MVVITGPQKQKATFGVRAAGCVSFFWLIGGGQQSGTPGILCSAWSYHPPPGWGPLFCRRTQRYCYAYFLSRNQDSASRLFHHLIAPPLFPYPSLPWSATVWICCLGLREGQGGWMKPRSYRQEMKNTEQICTLEPHRILLSFNSGNCETMTLITSCQNGA